MSACGFCITEEIEIKSIDSGDLKGDKGKLNQKSLPKDHTMDDVKNQVELTAEVSKGVPTEIVQIDNKSKAEDEDKKAEISEKASNSAIHEICKNFRKQGVPDFWANRHQMQNAYSLKAKGWKVQVKWSQSLIIGAGIGLFIAEDVKKGALIRVAKVGENLIRFRDESDIPKNLSAVTKNYIANYCGQVDDFAMIFLPGNCLNHSTDPSINMEIVDEGTIHLVACYDIKAGTELTQDYRSFGEPPVFLKDLASTHDMELVFKGFNAYV